MFDRNPQDNLRVITYRDSLPLTNLPKHHHLRCASWQCDDSTPQRHAASGSLRWSEEMRLKALMVPFKFFKLTNIDKLRKLHVFKSVGFLKDLLRRDAAQNMKPSQLGMTWMSLFDLICTSAAVKVLPHRHAKKCWNWWNESSRRHRDMDCRGLDWRSNYITKSGWTCFDWA